MLPVLLYHHVGDPLSPSEPNLTVTPAQFERHLRFLVRTGWRTLEPDDLVALRDAGRPPPRRSVLLTFDDGYAALAEHALPRLHRLGLKATVFLVTGRRTNTWDADHGVHGLALLDDDTVRHWAARGIAFGAHTRSHADLSTASEDQLADEVDGCAEDLTTLLGRAPTAFAYPWGLRSAAAEERVARRFDVAFTTDKGTNRGQVDWHRLERSNVDVDDGSAALVARLVTGVHPGKELRARVQLRTRLAHLRGGDHA